MSLKAKRIVVTGGEGFLGHHLVSYLRSYCSDLIVVRHADYDLLKDESVEAVYSVYKPDIVIHLAARVGGIQYNKANPGTLFYENLKMGLSMIHWGMLSKVEKFVCIGTICSYPRVPPRIPFIEDDIWEGYPEETNAGYGIAKKALLVQCRVYRKQYGMNCIYLLPVNMYGEYDNFSEESSHVIPALIKRFLYAKESNLEEVSIWGSGLATREFLYAGDCARVITIATDSYNSSGPLNVGSGQEIAIKDLANLIASIVHYTGRIVFDSSKPDGQPRRVLDTSRIQIELGFDSSSLLPLEEGLRRTVNWYLNRERV